MRCLSAAAVKRTQVLVKAAVGSVAYHFCSFTSQQTQDVSVILGSILVQLCQANPRSWDSVEELYHGAKNKANHEPKRPNVGTLEDLISLTTTDFPTTYVFIDAVNEARDTPAIFGSITHLSMRSPSLRIMMSSTEEISHTLTSMPVTTVAIDTEKTLDDIRDFIDVRISHDHGLQSLPELIKKDISSVLQSMANGKYCPQFLYILGFSSRNNTKSAFDGCNVSWIA